MNDTQFQAPLCSFDELQCTLIMYIEPLQCATHDWKIPFAYWWTEYK